MIVCIFEHVQWRWALNDRPALGYADQHEAARRAHRGVEQGGGGGAQGREVQGEQLAGHGGEALQRRQAGYLVVSIRHMQ